MYLDSICHFQFEHCLHLYFDVQNKLGNLPPKNIRTFLKLKYFL